MLQGGQGYYSVHNYITSTTYGELLLRSPSFTSGSSNASAFASLTTERVARVDANRPHVGLIRVTDRVVDGDKEADSRKHNTQDQQGQNQSVQD